MTAADLWLRLRALVMPRRVEREMREELAFHLDMLSRKHAADGLNGGDARRRAHAQFGSTAFVEDECRDARGVHFFETAWQDMRYALRGFRRAPTFAFAVVGTIALGLGLNIAVFTIFNAYVLRAVAVRAPQSLYAFTYHNRAGVYHGFSWPEYQQFERENQVFSDVFAGRKQLIVRIDEQVALGQLVTGNYFRMLGIDAALGRTLVPEDASTPGARPVVVLTYAYWQQHFASDPTIVGRKILVHGYPCEVVGVARSGFDGLDLLPHDFFAPITLDAQLEDGPDLFGLDHPAGRIEIIGRLKPGLSERSAEAALTLWSERLTTGEPDGEKATSALLESKATAIPMGLMAWLAIAPIGTAFCLVLVVACANVANMMIARAMARQREMGIRLALGASRSRLIRQLLTESLALALPAAAAGLVIAHITVEVGLHAILGTLPSEVAPYVKVMPLAADARVLGFSLLAAIGSALIFGLAPALQATRASVVRAARGDFLYDIRPTRARNALIIVQIAASTLLLVCAAVLLRGAQRVDGVNAGLRTRDVIDLDIREGSRAAVLSALAAEPLASSVAATIPDPPLDATAPLTAIVAAGSNDLVRAWYRHSSPEYFRVFDVPLVAGRNFTEEEAQSSADVAIISQTAARRLWPNQSPLGQLIGVRPDERATPSDARIRRYRSVRVVGVARDVVAAYADDEAERTGMYLPISVREPGSAIVVRVNGDPEAGKRMLDAELATNAPGAVEQLVRMQTFVDFRAYPFRAAYWVATAVGLLALSLAISGVYGVLSYLVTQRTKEIGIRIALGASVRAVAGLVLNQSLKLAGAGLAVGALLALAISRLLASQLVMMNTFDATAYSGGMLVVLVACVTAACFPAIRAARIDPIATLRHD